jgi:hypothetical protein
LSLYLNFQALDGIDLVTSRLDATNTTQAGPPGFLWTLDWLADRMPPGQINEHLFRLPILIASVLALFGCIWASRGVAARAKLGAVMPMLLTGLIVAVSPSMVDVTQRAKQYATDVLAVSLLIGVAAWLETATPWRRRLILGILAAFASVWSQPVLLVFPVLLLFDVWQQRTHLASAAGSLAVAGLGLLPVAYCGLEQRDEDLSSFWTASFAPWSEPAEVPVWLGKTWLELAEYLCEPAGGVLLIFVVAGIVHCWRRPCLGVLLAAPVAAMLGAFLHLYPMTGQRVSLFVLPSFAMLAALGVAASVRSLRHQVRLPVAATVCLALTLAIVAAALTRTLLKLQREPPDVCPAAKIAIASGLPMIAWSDALVWHLRAYEPEAQVVDVWTRGGENRMLVDRAVLVIGPKPGGETMSHEDVAAQKVPINVQVLRIERPNASSSVFFVRRKQE